MRAGWTPLAMLEQAAARTRIFDYPAGQTRQFVRDFSFCQKKKFAALRIEDPYGLSSDLNADRLKKFLEDIVALSGAWPAAFELRVRDENTPDFQARRRAFESWLVQFGGPAAKVHPVAIFGPRKRDFHDRRLTFTPNAKSLQNRVIVMLTGGVDRYVEPRFETTVIVHRTF